MFRIVLTIIISILGFAAFANTISGIVVDENGECLPYSTIRIMHKPIATLGDAYGCFTIKSESINQSDTLSITYIGYEPMKLAVNGLNADSTQTFKLQPATNLLNEITVNQKQKGKRKTVSKGKKHSWSLLKTNICGKTAGDTYGYEFHAKKNKKLFLDKVGFYYCEGDKQMTKMNFRINIYDMSNVKSEPTRNFINVLTEPIVFEYQLGDTASGKFEYTLPEQMVLPDDAMVEIEFLENLDDEIFWFKSNLIGGKSWSKLFLENIWVKTPFSTPFFIECVEFDQ